MTLESAIPKLINLRYNTLYSLHYKVAMSVISLRLPEDLDQKLAREAERVNRARSEIARDAIADYLARQERDRFLAQIAQAARARGADDAIEMAEEALPFDNEALELVEGPRASEPKAAYRTRKRKAKRR